MKRTRNRILTLLLSALMLIGTLPVTAGADSVTGFPDVPEDAWYVQYLGPIMEAQRKMGVNNIISGMYDDTDTYGKDTLVFQPDRFVKRGEFLKMLFEAAQSSGNPISLATDTTQSDVHWAGKYYTKAAADNILIADPYKSTENDTTEQSAAYSNVLFSCTFDDLEQTMNRYEMAVVLNNVCRNIAMQKTVNVDTPEEHISDYTDIPEEYRTAVEQMYGKGLLTGYEDFSFRGLETLTRAQAVTVIYRFLFLDTINGEGLQDWAAYPVVDTTNLSDPKESFAHWLNGTYTGVKHYYYQNGRTTLDNEARMKLYGTTAIDHYTSSYQAAGHMETVSVPIWTVDKSGQKIASTVGITVNTAVAEEVRSIFQMIFDDEEQFPIYGGWAAGGARYTDDMRHSWGCAIDVNALQNCECNTYSGSLRVTCGYGWWPLNTVWTVYAGSLSAPSIYSIGKNEGDYGHSVVEAFETYGWGWGGNGYSNGKKYDYMHFSVLSSGG